MIEIKSKSKGAELESIIVDGVEKLHDGVKYWNRHSPILFPIVGQIKEGKTIIEGKEYQMGQHGFARDMEFEVIGENKYSLKYNEQTLEKYPYKFELVVSHCVEGNSVITKYEVKNLDDKGIYFGLGAHPAFRCDYPNAELHFEQAEDEIEIYQLENGLIKDKPEDKSEFIDGNKIVLNEHYFDNDAVIMKNLKSNSVELKEGKKTIVKFDFTEFPILAIWSNPGANYLCIEPWFNTADNVSGDGIYSHKAGILHLGIGEKFECKYKMEF